MHTNNKKFEEVFSTLLSKIVYTIENLTNRFSGIIFHFSTLITIHENNKEGDLHQCATLKLHMLVSLVLFRFD